MVWKNIIIKLDIILQWLTIHNDCNESAELLSAFQFDELTIDCLKSIKGNPLLEQEHKLLIQETLNMKYEQELERQPVEIQKERKMLEKQKQHVQIKQQKQTQNEYLLMNTTSGQIKQYNFITKKWIELKNVPDWVDDWTSWYASEHRISVAGAALNNVLAGCVAVLDMKSRSVKELPRLPAARMWPGVVDGDEVCIIGGWNRYNTPTNTVYYTNLTQNNGWTTLSTMPTATWGSVISVDSDHIYIFSGYPDDTLTQIYDKHTQQWSRGATMPAKCDMSNGRCIKEGNTLTIITKNTIMEYHSNNNRWKVIKRYTPHREFISAVSYNGDILSCGVHKERSHDMTLTVTMCGLKLVSILAI